MVLEFVLASGTGALAKIADEPPHGSFNFRKFLKYGSGLSYGIAGGYLLSVSPVFSALALAIVAGVLVAGKIDDRNHQLGIAAMLVSGIYFGFVVPDMFLMLFLLALGIADEYLNDAIDRRKKASRPLKLFEMVLGSRVVLPLGALGVSIATGNYALFLAVAAFDIGYKISGFAVEKYNSG